MKANYKVFEELCKEKNVTPYRVAKDTGLNKTMMYHWEKGRYSPKVDKIMILAKYFHVGLERFYV